MLKEPKKAKKMSASEEEILSSVRSDKPLFSKKNLISFILFIDLIDLSNKKIEELVENYSDKMKVQLFLSILESSGANLKESENLLKSIISNSQISDGVFDGQNNIFLFKAQESKSKIYKFTQFWKKFTAM